MTWFSTLLGPLINGVGNYLKAGQELKAKRLERKDELELLKHKAKIARIERGDNTERDYDLVVLQNAASTIIDEVMIIWTLSIVTCLFIPSLAPYALEGFKQLEQVPMWFSLIVVGAFISKLGLRFLFSGRTLLGKGVK